MNKILKAILGVSIIAILSAFLVKDKFISKPQQTINTADVVNEGIWNKHLVDSTVAMLRSGYIVLRTGIGADRL